MDRIAIIIVGCTPATPAGVCDECSGSGLLDKEDADGSVYPVFCPDCDGRGGTDPQAVVRARAFDAAYREALCR